MTSPSANSLFTATPAGVSPGTTFAELYERFLVEPIFTPWASVLVDRAGVRAGDAALDVACGTGAVARLVRRRAGARAPLVGVDRNSEMLAVARRVDDSIDWREGDAAALPVREDERFDVVFCHQGLQFFPDKPAALGEMRRVLRPGGRVVLGVWRSLAENGLLATWEESPSDSSARFRTYDTALPTTRRSPHC